MVDGIQVTPEVAVQAVFEEMPVDALQRPQVVGLMGGAEADGQVLQQGHAPFTVVQALLERFKQVGQRGERFIAGLRGPQHDRARELGIEAAAFSQYKTVGQGLGGWVRVDGQCQLEGVRQEALITVALVARHAVGAQHGVQNRKVVRAQGVVEQAQFGFAAQSLHQGVDHVRAMTVQKPTGQRTHIVFQEVAADLADDGFEDAVVQIVPAHGNAFLGGAVIADVRRFANRPVGVGQVLDEILDHVQRRLRSTILKVSRLGSVGVDVDVTGILVQELCLYFFVQGFCGHAAQGRVPGPLRDHALFVRLQCGQVQFGALRLHGGWPAIAAGDRVQAPAPGGVKLEQAAVEHVADVQRTVEQRRQVHRAIAAAIESECVLQVAQLLGVNVADHLAKHTALKRQPADMQVFHGEVQAALVQ